AMIAYPNLRIVNYLGAVVSGQRARRNGHRGEAVLRQPIFDKHEEASKLLQPSSRFILFERGGVLLVRFEVGCPHNLDDLLEAFEHALETRHPFPPFFRARSRAWPQKCRAPFPVLIAPRPGVAADRIKQHALRPAVVAFHFRLDYAAIVLDLKERLPN